MFFGLIECMVEVVSVDGTFCSTVVQKEGGGGIKSWFIKVFETIWVRKKLWGDEMGLEHFPMDTAVVYWSEWTVKQMHFSSFISWLPNSLLRIPISLHYSCHFHFYSAKENIHNMFWCMTALNDLPPLFFPSQSLETKHKHITSKGSCISLAWLPALHWNLNICKCNVYR